MIGTYADAVITDAWLKGFRDYNIKLSYEAVRKDAMAPPDCDTKKDGQTGAFDLVMKPMSV